METPEKEIKIRTIFMGTGPFGLAMLEALHKNDYNLVGVFTKPDRNISKNVHVTNEVRDYASAQKLPLYQPETVDSDTAKIIKELKPDLIIVASYGKILPREILDLPGFGCINIHASLLPKFRGPSPIQNALLLGEKETGVTIMLMDEGVDTGSMLNQQKLRIAPEDNRITLLEKLALLGSDLLLETLPLWVKRRIEPQAQDESAATVCQLIDREDGRILWNEDAETIINKYRALCPWPGVFCFFQTEPSAVPQRLKLNRISLAKTEADNQARVPGEVFLLEEKLTVQAIAGSVILEEIQLEGKKSLPSSEFLNGYPQIVGTILK